MGFLAGRVSFLRFRVERSAPKLFGAEHLAKLSARAIGTQQAEEKDGTEVGWIAGDDILDVEFDLAKNVVDDALQFALRVDTRKLPADLLRAYGRAELRALSANNPSGFPSAKQKKAAREAARDRLDLEARDGRYTRRKAYPLLWDRPSNCLLASASSVSVIDRLLAQFKETFGCGLTPLDAGRQIELVPVADRPAEVRPSAFVPAGGEADVAWVKDPASPRFLGNEFLLWLWFILESDDDTLKLSDGSEATVMFARTLALECPRAVSGSETIRSDSPVKLPEARRAIRAGKLPRQAGLTLVRQGQQYELTLRAEMLGVSGAKLPATEEGDERARLEERVGQVRHLVETIDLLYGTFLRRRLGADWGRELKRLQRWLQRDEDGSLASAG